MASWIARVALEGAMRTRLDVAGAQAGYALLRSKLQCVEVANIAEPGVIQRVECAWCGCPAHASNTPTSLLRRPLRSRPSSACYGALS